MCVMAYNTWMTLRGRETVTARIPELTRLLASGMNGASNEIFT
jgi:hypothetical protein